MHSNVWFKYREQGSWTFEVLAIWFFRYWSHVVNCSSCRVAYKGLNALEVVLQVMAIVSIGIVAATKQNVLSAVTRTALVLMAVLCFAASRWLAHFIYKNFHFHDYNHALLWNHCFTHCSTSIIHIKFDQSWNEIYEMPMSKISFNHSSNCIY